MTLSMLGMPEIIIIGIVVLVLFNAHKVPELMKGVRSGIKKFMEGDPGDS